MDELLLKPKFKIEKTLQVVASFLKKADKCIDIYTLVKLVYILDRESYKRWGFAVTYDNYASLPFGPVPSQTYDFLKGEEQNEWQGYIVRINNSVYLKQEPQTKLLSRAVEKLISELYVKYGELSFGELKDITHQFKEYENPGDSSTSIPTVNLIRAVVDNEEDVQHILKEQKEQAKYERIASLYA